MADDDLYLWLEDIAGDEQLDWVRKHNDPTVAEFSDERFEQMRAEALEVLDTDARIPYVRRRGEYLYNFWRDAENPRGLWQRTTLESYLTEDPGTLAKAVFVDQYGLPQERADELVEAGAGKVAFFPLPGEVLDQQQALADLFQAAGQIPSKIDVATEFDTRFNELVAEEQGS